MVLERRFYTFGGVGGEGRDCKDENTVNFGRVIR